MDGVSGATITSTAIKEAAAAALTAAGLNPDDYKTAVENDASAEDSTVDADVVVVGAGGAGMTAAITAAAEGKSVVILESQSMVGGNSVRATGGMNAGKTVYQDENEFGESAGVEIADLLKTRDITRSAICRSLVRIFLDQKTKAPGHIPYARVLGFQKNSAPLLSQIKKNSSIPLITKAADASAILDETAFRLFNETCAASNLYEMLLCHKTGQPFIHEMKKPLRII